MLRRKGCKIALLVFALLLVGFAAVFGGTIQDLWSRGIIQALFSKPEKRTYSGDSAENLRAIHTALMLYHDSEEKFPEGNGWMDAIEGRIRTTDMDKAEAEKKLIRPEFRSESGKFGYAINDAAAGKYRDDVGDPKTPLVFESRETGRNAHGDPAKIGEGEKPLAVAMDGTLLNER